MPSFLSKLLRFDLLVFVVPFHSLPDRCLLFSPARQPFPGSYAFFFLSLSPHFGCVHIPVASWERVHRKQNSWSLYTRDHLMLRFNLNFSWRENSRIERLFAQNFEGTKRMVSGFQLVKEFPGTLTLCMAILRVRCPFSQCSELVLFILIF